MRFARYAAVVAVAAMSASFLSTPATAGGTTAERLAPQLTIERAATGTIVTGDKVTFNGTAPTSLEGKRVTLQRRVGKKGEWVKVATAAVSNGTMSATGVATGIGKNSWRFASVVDRVRYSSKVLTTTVYGWFYLYDLDYVDADGGYEDSWSIGGKSYSKSVGGSGSSSTDWIEYNLSYRCLTLDANYGIGDDSETGTTADFYITLDGDRTLVGSKGLGSATHLTVDTSTRLRVRLEMDPTNSSEPDGSWAFGDAKVLCSGKP